MLTDSIAIPILLVVLAVASCSVMGLVAIWAGLSRRHWFLRAAVVGGVLALGLAIPAYELMLTFSVQAAVTIACLTVIRYWGRRPQYSLADLLLLMVVVAAVVPVVTRVPAEAWKGNDDSYAFVPWYLWYWLSGEFTLDLSTVFTIPPTMKPPPWLVFGLTGVVFAILTLVATWAGLGKARWPWRLTTALVVFPSSIMVGCLGLWRTIRNAAATGHWIRKWVGVAELVSLVVAILLPCVAVYGVLAFPPPIPVAELPDPNGFDDLVEASRMLSSATVPDPETAGQKEVEPFVNQYTAALKRARLGLSRECLVPLRYSMADITDDPTMEMRQVVRAFNAEGHLAEMQGRTDDAVRSYLDAMRLGRAVGHGGLLVDLLIGRACEGIGIESLHRLLADLTPAQSRKLIEELSEFESPSEPLEEVLVRDSIWESHAMGWQGRLSHALDKFTTRADAWLSPFDHVERRRDARLGILLAELAIRCYTAEHDRPPGQLADLVPRFPPSVPLDPFTGEPLVYQPQEKGYLLYSTGLTQDNDEWGGPPRAKKDAPSLECGD